MELFKKFVVETIRIAPFIFVFFAQATPSYAKPNKVIIVRHGEKVYGGNYLTLRGYERASALPYFFSGNPLFNTPIPSYIFAAGLVDADSSVRPLETCSPTANHLKLPLNIEFKAEETAKLAKELLTNPKYDKANIIICWEHRNIRPLTIALGAEDPGVWQGDIFDLVYMLNYDKSEKPKLYKILQKLLFGDRATFNDTPFPLPSHIPANEDLN